MANYEHAREPHTAANGLVPVELTKRFGKFNPGEVVGLKREVAEELVEGRNAKYVRPTIKPAGK